MSGVDRADEARRLHEAGYTRRAVWAKWTLDAFGVLHGHLTESDGSPLVDDGKMDSSFYLDADEWDEVAEAARTIAALASLVATYRKFGWNE